MSTQAGRDQRNRVEGLESWHSQMIVMIQPTMGMMPTSCAQPLRSVSWSRLVVTAMYGSKVARVKASESFSLMMLRHAVAMRLNKTHHQNSDRDAVPRKVAYLLKQVLIDSLNSMVSSVLGFDCAVVALADNGVRLWSME